MASARIWIAGIVFAGALAALSAVYSPIPWAGVLFSFVILAAAGAVELRRPLWKTALTCGAAALAALSLFEVKLGIETLRGDGTRMEGTIVDGFIEPNDLLGYAPAKGKRVTARKLYGDSVIYDVVYTIGSNGLRVTPPTDALVHRSCVAFFGDSVTFGEGVNDRESFPYQVAIKSGGRFEVYNFAFSGYGPHQMLAALQGGLVAQTMPCAPVRVVYLALVDHVARVAGLTPWDRHGPRFELGAGEGPLRSGHFDDPTRLGTIAVPRWASSALDTFFTMQKLFGRARAARPEDLRLFLAVVRESAREIRARYPESEFHVILWDDRVDSRLSIIDASLRAAGITVHRLTTIIPDYSAAPLRYMLSEHDQHPNALRHGLVADYIVRKILPRTENRPDGSSRATPQNGGMR